jgi:hypothetical protein
MLMQSPILIKITYITNKNIMENKTVVEKTIEGLSPEE